LLHARRIRGALFLAMALWSGGRFGRRVLAKASAAESGRRSTRTS
jgi:hypothetical protein